MEKSRSRINIPDAEHFQKLFDPKLINRGSVQRELQISGQR